MPAEDHGRHARLDLLRQADPEIEAERPGNHVLEIGAQRLARCTAHQFANRPAECQTVIAVAVTRSPERFLCRQPLAHVVPVVDAVGLQLLPQHRHADRMVQHHAHGGILLVARRELRPDVAHGRGEIEGTLADQCVRADRSGTLGAGKDHGYRVLLPGCLRRLVGDPAPQIRHDFSVQGHAQAGTNLSVFGKIARERFPDRREPIRDLSLNSRFRHLFPPRNIFPDSLQRSGLR